jgi:hypothetical protein
MFAQDGTSSTLSSPGSTHSVRVEIRIGDVELVQVVLPRIRMVQ